MKRKVIIAALVLSMGITALFLSFVYMIVVSPSISGSDANFSGNIEYEGETRIHSIRVLENATRMRCILACEGNDFDLYGRLNIIPTISEYDFRGYSDEGEDLYYDNPEAGIWHMMVHSYSGIGHYDLYVVIEYE